MTSRLLTLFAVCTLLVVACDSGDSGTACDNGDSGTACDNGDSGTCGGKGIKCSVDASFDANTQSDAGGSGETCGGLLGDTCPGAEFCEYTVAAHCGSGDQPGTCRVAPSACSKELAPVCGCDQVTYDNACAAAAARTSVLSTGACD